MYRQTNLLCRINRCLFAFDAHSHKTFDVFNNYDRVIYQNPQSDYHPDNR